VFQLVTSFNGLSLTDTEVGLFAAIVLLTPDRPGVSDVKTVQHSQDRIVEAFKLQVSRRHRPMVVFGEQRERKCQVLSGHHPFTPMILFLVLTHRSVPVVCLVYIGIVSVQYKTAINIPTISDYLTFFSKFNFSIV